MTRSLIFSTALIWGLVHAKPAWAGCEKDTDCKGDRICENSACVSPPSTSPPAENSPQEEQSESAAESSDAESTSDEAPENEAKETTDKAQAVPVAETDPKDWWKQTVRAAEVPVLQEIFNSMPRPVLKKGSAKLLYHRAVPVVVADIHTTTTLWGGKDQVNVKFMGISKVHSTTTMEAISETTPGIAYCPINCDRITTIQVAGDNIIFMYDGDIKDWGGKASDVHSGYTRKVGKHNRAICSFPVLENLAPGKAWLDPEEVKAVQSAAVNEIKRYCGR